MNTNFIASLRVAVSALALVILFSPVAANAYTSNGTDGKFEPTVSMVLDSTRQIFNFTSIFIPSGVTVSFSGLSSAQPFELLATGNIDIAGTLDAGANSLWIETPGSISFPGTLNSSGGTLSLVASNINITGAITGTLTGGKGVPTDGGSVIAVRGGILTSGGGDINITSRANPILGERDAIRITDRADGAILNITDGANLNITARANPILGERDAILSGARSITRGGGAISIVSGGGIVNISGGDLSGNVSLLSPVPEPGVWVMLSLGMCALFAASRRRPQNIHLA